MVTNSSARASCGDFLTPLERPAELGEEPAAR